MSRDVADDWYYLRVIERPLATNGWVSGLFLRCKFGTQLGNKAIPEKATARKRKPSTGREIRLKVATTPLANRATHSARPRDIFLQPTRETCRVNATLCVRTRASYSYFIASTYIFIPTIIGHGSFVKCSSRHLDNLDFSKILPSLIG